MNSVLIGERDFSHRDTQGEDSHMMIEAEIRIMLPQIKECQGLLGTTKKPVRGKRGFFP